MYKAQLKAPNKYFLFIVKLYTCSFKLPASGCPSSRTGTESRPRVLRGWFILIVCSIWETKSSYMNFKNILQTFYFIFLFLSSHDAKQTPYWWHVTTQIWVALLTGHAAREICFNQSTALPKTGSTKTRNPESGNRKWNHGNGNGIKNRKIKKFKFLSLSTIQRDFVIVCLCTSFESVTYKDGRLRAQYHGIFSWLTLYFGKPKERVTYNRWEKYLSTIHTKPSN